MELGPGTLGKKAAEREVGSVRIHNGGDGERGEGERENTEHRQPKAIEPFRAAAISLPEIVEVDAEHPSGQARADTGASVAANVDADRLDRHRAGAAVCGAQRRREALPGWIGRVRFAVDDDGEDLAARAFSPEMLDFGLDPARLCRTGRADDNHMIRGV